MQLDEKLEERAPRVPDLKTILGARGTCPSERDDSDRFLHAQPRDEL